jgi:ABC-2 type transport system ATP-binding protein
MGSLVTSEIAGSAQVTHNPDFTPPASKPSVPEAVVEFVNVSKWYGHVIGVNNFTLRIPVGVTGLLGPNGAGKSTLLQLATGQLRPSQGDVLVLGHRAWNNPGLNRYVGLCPEQDAFYEWMTGREFVTTCARLGGFPRNEAAEAAARAIEGVRMTEHADRPVKGYSKGMRQRTKLAQALVHDPLVLFLDEPLTGTDPVARRDLLDIINRLGDDGRSVIVSSHVLHEVQAVTPNIVLMNHGRLVAEGDVRQIRDLIDTHPHRIVIKCPDVRALASKLVREADVVGIELSRRDGAILVETRSPDHFYGRLASIALEPDTPVEEVYSDDDNLEAVFKYLVNS